RPASCHEQMMVRSSRDDLERGIVDSVVVPERASSRSSRTVIRSIISSPTGRTSEKEIREIDDASEASERTRAQEAGRAVQPGIPSTALELRAPESGGPKEFVG